MPRNLKHIHIHTPKEGPYGLNRVLSADRVNDPGLSSSTAATQGRSSPQGRLNEWSLFPRNVPLGTFSRKEPLEILYYLGSFSGKNKKQVSIHKAGVF